MQASANSSRHYQKNLVESGTWIVRIPGMDLWTMFYQISVEPLSEGSWEGEVTVAKISHLPGSEWLASAHLTRTRGRGTSVGRHGELEAGLSLPLVIENLIHLILFTKYWNWETKVIQPWGLGICQNEPFINNSPFPVEVMESAWLAELIRSEAFASGSRAEGYFRMQRSGPRLTRRKLVWVSRFPKQC